MAQIDPNSDNLAEGQPSLPLATWYAERVNINVRSISIDTALEHINIASAKTTLGLVLEMTGFKRNEFSAFRVTSKGVVTISRTLKSLRDH
jgi:hypothetical protein